MPFSTPALKVTGWRNTEAQNCPLPLNLPNRLPDLSEQDDGGPVVHPAQAAQRFPPVHLGHQEVHHHQIRLSLFDLPQSLFAIGRHGDLETRSLQKRGVVVCRFDVEAVTFCY